jgi:hypothetical protein
MIGGAIQRLEHGWAHNRAGSALSVVATVRTFRPSEPQACATGQNFIVDGGVTKKMIRV